MKLNKLLMSTVLISIIALVPVNASKKYYEYKAKARPANGVMGRIGDHAYVCVKKKKKKHGHMRTIRNYGCYSQGTWGTSRGHTTARYFVKKTSKSKKRFKGAKCTAVKKACSLVGFPRYLNWGVCHQAANRFLYGANKYAIIGSRTRGFMNGFNSYRKYGAYGKHWDTCKRACYR